MLLPLPDSPTMQQVLDAADKGELKEAFGDGVLPINLPTKGCTRVIDCFDNTVFGVKIGFQPFDFNKLLQI